MPESYGDIEVDLPPGEKLHAVLGASGSERWMNCSGSINMSKGMPNKSSIYAMEGTAAHHLGELCLLQDISADVLEGQWITYSGQLLEDEPEVDPGGKTIFYDGTLLNAVDPAFPINEQMVRAVNIYLETIDKYMNWAREKFGVEPQLLVEKSFDLGSVFPGMFGTNDVCIFVPGKCLIVIDYKHGRGKAVEIRGNSQLKYYGLGGTIELCIDPADLPPEIETVVVQPRKSHKDGFVRSAIYSTEEITVQFRQELIDAALATEELDAPLNPGDWCFFCPGKVKCPKITGKFEALTKVEFYDLSEEELGMPSEIVTRAVQNVTTNPELMGRFLEFAPIMESVIDAVRDYALQQVIAGIAIPGQKLSRKDTKRKYTDEEIVGRALMAAGLEVKDIYVLKLKSPSALKKLGVKKWKIIDEILTTGEFVFKPEGAYTLADADDAEKPEIVLEAFGDLTLEDLSVNGQADDPFDIL